MQCTRRDVQREMGAVCNAPVGVQSIMGAVCNAQEGVCKAKREQCAMHKRHAERTESSVQCTRRDVLSKMGAACNALGECKANGEQRAMHKRRAKETGATCSAQERVCKALWERCAMHKRGRAK